MAVYNSTSKKAEEFIRKGLIIRENIYGNNHTDVAASYNNLGRIYLSLSDYRQAEENVKKALMIRIKLLGENHPSVAQLYYSLGNVYEHEDLLAKAAECYTQAYNIWSSKLPADDKRVVRAKEKLDKVKAKIN